MNTLVMEVTEYGKNKANMSLVLLLIDFAENDAALTAMRDTIYLKFLQHAQDDSDEDGRLLSLRIRFVKLLEVLLFSYEAANKKHLVLSSLDENAFCHYYGRKFYGWMQKNADPALTKRYFSYTHR